MVLATLILIASTAPANVSHYALPGGATLAIKRGPIPQGARVWSCKGDPVIGGFDALKTLDPGTSPRGLTVSKGGMSFSPPNGNGPGGSCTYTGIQESFYEGQQVTITLTADNFIVSFRGENLDGKSVPMNRGARHPWTPSNSPTTFTFTFQPQPNRRCSIGIIGRPERPSEYTSWGGTINWTYTPGDAPPTPAKAGSLTVIDAQRYPDSPKMLRFGASNEILRSQWPGDAPALKGVAADGVSLVALKGETDKPGTAVFMIQGAGGGLYGQGDTPKATVGRTSLEAKCYPVGGGKFAAFALYRPPSSFGYGTGNKHVTFGVRFRAEGATQLGAESNTQISLVRPPVILVHGTYDNPKYCYQDIEPIDDAPTNLEPYLTSKGFRVWCTDWEDTNGMKDDPPSNFMGNKVTVLKNQGGIAEAIRKMRSEDIAVTQADLVCHSQGGVIARMYCRGYDFGTNIPVAHQTDPYDCSANGVHCRFHRMDNYWMGDIHRLITISSTHRGSHVCNVFKILEDHPDRGFEKLWIDLFRAFVDKTVSGITTGGFYNQVPDSNELQAIGPTPVPSFAIACVATDDDMTNVRPDPITDSWRGSIPNYGNYWNKLFKIWIGTSEDARDLMFEKMTAIAKAKGIPGADERLAAYREVNRKLRSKYTSLNGFALGVALKTVADVLDPESMKDLDRQLKIMRSIVFEGDLNDCTVAEQSSYGGLAPQYTFRAEHVLHGWAPRYRHVQRKVFDVLTCDGGMLDPNGFPGYKGGQSQASTFAVPIPINDMGSAPGPDVWPDRPAPKPADPKFVKPVDPNNIPGKPKPGEITPPKGVSLAGKWDTEASISREPYTLTVNGNQVTGSGPNGLFTLKGTFDGRKLTFTYSKGVFGETGNGELTLSADGNHLEGFFIMGDDPDKTRMVLKLNRMN